MSITRGLIPIPCRPHNPGSPCIIVTFGPLVPWGDSGQSGTVLETPGRRKVGQAEFFWSTESHRRGWTASCTLSGNNQGRTKECEMPLLRSRMDIVKDLPDRKPREPCVVISGLRKVYLLKASRPLRRVVFYFESCRHPSHPETPLGPEQIGLEGLQVGPT